MILTRSIPFPIIAVVLSAANVLASPISSSDPSSLFPPLLRPNTTQELDDPNDPFIIPNWAPGYTTTLSSFSPPYIPHFSFFHFTERATAYLEGFREGSSVPSSAPIPHGRFSYSSQIFSSGMVLSFQLWHIWSSEKPLLFNETEGLLESLKFYLREWRSHGPMGARLALWKETSGENEKIAEGMISGVSRRGVMD